ncbi:DUF418 domain-containing protein [Corynebacterium alimapuense]|uniref:DUF418 domain-containing protein n=1 Tax=Corynebacterium alimapuense TaxID=1576874 RepID=A0A3M8K825_9CORY|nr:DUF418 domain-containing protein [Corynebacterium alimapuense]RNE49296.1 hypothetical protein C5L39_02710 [Corynebacterium alimapuense]
MSLPDSAAPPESAGQPSPRYLVPDLARGLALLGIAAANMPTAWSVAEGADYAGFFGGVFGDGNIFENLAVVFSAMFVHVRGLPMFTTLLGFGVGMITLSLWRRNYSPRQARWVLWRRYGILAVFGTIHLVLLFFGDIMLAYGLGVMIVALLITLGDRSLMVVAWVMLSLQLLLSMLGALVLWLEPTALVSDSPVLGDDGSYVSYLNTNLSFGLEQLTGLPFVVFMLVPLMLIGFVWARRGVLSDPGAHLGTLRRWLALAVLVMVGIGLPWGLAAIDILPAGAEVVLAALNYGFGMLTGPGIIAAVALATRSLQARVDDARAQGNSYRLSLPVVALMALGKRSMSGYVLQSLLFVVITQPFVLGWGSDSGILIQLGLALLVWLITLVLALLWDRVGWAGPLEAVHRRLAYGKDGLRRPLPVAAKN